MIFTSWVFVAFLAAMLAAYWALPRRGQNLLLLAGSYLFYGWVHPWYCALLAFSTVLDFLCGLGMARFPARRRWLLVASLAGNLGMLGGFKYHDFFAVEMQAVLDALGLSVSLPLLRVALPVGISFYTFQTLSYTIDVARGRCEPRRSLVDFAVFVAMFPQLVAGPIERAVRLLPQIEARRTLDLPRVETGLCLIAWGYFKKLVVADNLVPYVDRIFELERPSGVVLAAGALAFAVQILADFSAYTDIARGVARLFGFELVRNFDAPYLARSPSDFWRRWHVSFSTWIRDYLYIPLGGSRGGRARFVVAATVSLTLSGLWHGASWNFVLWGVYHAVLVVAYHLVFRRVGERLEAALGAGATTVLAVATMFALTLVGWVIFRQQDAALLLGYLGPQLLAWTREELVVAAGVTSLVLLLSAPMILQPLALRLAPAGRVARAGLVWACFLGVLLLGRDEGVDFIYFVF